MGIAEQLEDIRDYIKENVREDPQDPKNIFNYINGTVLPEVNMLVGGYR